MTPTGPDIGTSSHNRLSNRRAVGSAVRLRGAAWARLGQHLRARSRVKVREKARASG